MRIARASNNVRIDCFEIGYTIAERYYFCGTHERAAESEKKVKYMFEGERLI